MDHSGQSRDAQAARALEFAAELFGSAFVSFYWIDADRPLDFRLRNVDADFHALYLARMQAVDPLSVPRLVRARQPVLALDDQDGAGDPAAYRAFLHRFGLGEMVEFLFCKDGRPFAGMGLACVCMWRLPMTAMKAASATPPTGRCVSESVIMPGNSSVARNTSASSAVSSSPRRWMCVTASTTAAASIGRS